VLVSTQTFFAQLAMTLQSMDRALADQIAALDATYICCRKRQRQLKTACHTAAWQDTGSCGVRVGQLLQGREPLLQHLPSFAERQEENNPAVREDPSNPDAIVTCQSSTKSGPLMSRLDVDVSTPEASKPIAIQQPHRANREGGMQRVHSWSGDLASLSASYDTPSLMSLRTPVSPPLLPRSVPHHANGPWKDPGTDQSKVLEPSTPFVPTVQKLYCASRRMYEQVPKNVHCALFESADVVAPDACNMSA
jgi:hypothetical protein